MKKLTIIIPTYKKPESLKRLLVSIEEKTSRELTDVIVVSDDGTTFNGPEWVRSTVLGNQTGAIIGIWKGVLISNSEIVGVLGDDTELITDRIDEIIISNMDNRVMGLNDGIQEGRAHPFMFKANWFSSWGLAPCYRHYYADTELYKICKHHNFWKFNENAVIKHHHEYAQSKGHDVEILEETKDASKKASYLDSQIFKKRINWWLTNSQPENIPWNIGIK